MEPGPSSRRTKRRSLSPCEESEEEFYTSAVSDREAMLTRKRKEVVKDTSSSSCSGESSSSVATSSNISVVSAEMMSLTTNGFCLFCTQISSEFELLALSPHASTQVVDPYQRKRLTGNELSSLQEVMRILKINPTQILRSSMHIPPSHPTPGTSAAAGAEEESDNYEMYTELCEVCEKYVRRASKLQQQKKRYLEKLARRIVVSETAFGNVQVLGENCGENPTKFAQLLREAIKRACEAYASDQVARLQRKEGPPPEPYQSPMQEESSGGSDYSSAHKCYYCLTSFSSSPLLQSHLFMNHMMQLFSAERFAIVSEKKFRRSCHKMQDDVISEGEVVHSQVGGEPKFFCGYCGVEQVDQHCLHGHFIAQHGDLLQRKLAKIQRRGDLAEENSSDAQGEDETEVGESWDEEEEELLGLSRGVPGNTGDKEGKDSPGDWISSENLSEVGKSEGSSRGESSPAEGRKEKVTSSEEDKSSGEKTSGGESSGDDKRVKSAGESSEDDKNVKSPGESSDDQWETGTEEEGFQAGGASMLGQSDTDTSDEEESTTKLVKAQQPVTDEEMASTSQDTQYSG